MRRRPVQLDFGEDFPATLPITHPQPEPIQWFVSSLPSVVAPVTAITRVWDEGDTQRCRLCPQCTADHALGVCLVQVRCEVESGSAPLFSTHGMNDRGNPRLPLRHISTVQGNAVR